MRPHVASDLCGYFWSLPKRAVKLNRVLLSVLVVRGMNNEEHPHNPILAESHRMSRIHDKSSIFSLSKIVHESRRIGKLCYVRL